RRCTEARHRQSGGGRHLKRLPPAPPDLSFRLSRLPGSNMDRSNESMGSPILGETIAAIGGILGHDLDAIGVERVVVGLFFTGVKLDNGVAGACATPLATLPHTVCCPSSALAMPFPGKLKGRPAGELAREALAGHGIRRAVGIAAVNALADCC